MREARPILVALLLLTGVVSLHGATAAHTKSAQALTIQAYSSGEPAAMSNSYLVSGDREAILVDVVQMRFEAARLAAMVQGSGKKLTTIFITHAHPDHFLGLDVVVDRFPEVRVVSTRSVVEDVERVGPTLVALLSQKWGAEGPARLLVPTPLAGDEISLEGRRIRVLEFGEGECAHLAALLVPDAKAFFSADLVSNRMHLFLREKRVESWRRQLDELEPWVKANGVATIYPGHGRPGGVELVEQTGNYLRDFAEAAATGNGQEAVRRLKARYPTYEMARFLTQYSIPAFFPDYKEE